MVKITKNSCCFVKIFHFHHEKFTKPCHGNKKVVRKQKVMKNKMKYINAGRKNSSK